MFLYDNGLRHERVNTGKSNTGNWAKLEKLNNNFNPLSANPIKWWNTLKQFVGNLPTNCLSVFDHFVKLPLKGLTFLSKSILTCGFKAWKCNYIWKLRRKDWNISPATKHRHKTGGDCLYHSRSRGCRAIVELEIFKTATTDLLINKQSYNLNISNIFRFFNAWV